MAESNTDQFFGVLKGLMRPLVRILISRGVTAPAFYRLLKSVYVETAYEEFRITADKPPTDSRISMLTGVHRRDVRAVLSEVDGTWEASRAKTASFATVLGQWMARPSLQTKDGQHVALPRTAPTGPSFEALVASISRDIRPRTILDELLRQGLVIEGEDGLLRIVPDAVVGPASDDHKVVFFASNIGDHLAAAADNLLSEDPKFLERAVFYNRLTSADVDALELQARNLSQDVLEKLNTTSSEMQQASKDAKDNNERYRFGVYFFRESAVSSGQAGNEDDDSETT
ncbi:MAG: DUF6502 family protein [Pseudomonadota bacterium]